MLRRGCGRCRAAEAVGVEGCRPAVGSGRAGRTVADNLFPAGTRGKGLGSLPVQAPSAQGRVSANLCLSVPCKTETPPHYVPLKPAPRSRLGGTGRTLPAPFSVYSEPSVVPSSKPNTRRISSIPGCVPSSPHGSARIPRGCFRGKRRGPKLHTHWASGCGPQIKTSRGRVWAARSREGGCRLLL